MSILHKRKDCTITVKCLDTFLRFILYDFLVKFSSHTPVHTATTYFDVHLTFVQMLSSFSHKIKMLERFSIG